MKRLLVLLILVLALYAVSLPLDAKNCKHIWRCAPTATPTRPPQLVFYPVWNVQGVSTVSGWICRLFGTQTWFSCKPYSVKMPSGQVIYGFIRI